MGDIDARLIESYLSELCSGATDRHVGGRGNRAACKLFARVAESHGFDVEIVELPCVVWERGESALQLGDTRVTVNAGPYSPSCTASGRLAAAATIEELERGGLNGCVLLVHGELAKEQLAPKNFTFYNPASHKRIVAALEASGALAIVAATDIDPGLAGGASPFPLIEDADFPLPSAYIAAADAPALLDRLGEVASVAVDSRAVPSTAPQVIARTGSGERRVVVFAHIDSKDGAPGALDNASGVSAMLGLAHLLESYVGPLRIELVPLNGEDYYAATGQMFWLAENHGHFDDIVLGMNVDGAGFAGDETAVSLYECPGQTTDEVRRAAESRGFVIGPQWPQGDHSLFAMKGVPAIAVTSSNVFFNVLTVAHTERDVPELVDCEQVAQVSRFFADVIGGLGTSAQLQ
jgi:aminopeptidase YwaD